jgi:hypothetical protein
MARLVQGTAQRAARRQDNRKCRPLPPPRTHRCYGVELVDCE